MGALLWAEKHRPRRVSEVIGNEEAVAEFVKWMSEWERKAVPKQKAAFFYGPPGTGKTSLVLAYSEERGYDLVQVNASDRRTAEDLRSVLAHATASNAVLGGRRMVLIDEVEGAVMSAESGSVAALTELVDRTSVPLVLIANDVWDQRLMPLRERCKLIAFRRLRSRDIEERLRTIAQREGLRVDEELVKTIAQRSRGDLRAAINDLQAIAVPVTGSRVVTELLESREVELNAFELMAKVFGARSLSDGRGVLTNAGLDIDGVMTWVSENLQTQIKDPKALEEAYRILADADLHLRRASRFQRWELMKYGTALLSAGPGIVKSSTSERGGRFEFPSRIRFLQQTRVERELTRSVLEKVASRTHMSTSKAATEFLPYLRMMMKAGDMGVAKSLGLTEREVDTLLSKAPELQVKHEKPEVETARPRTTVRARRARRG
ncbi:MAG: replication factor C large subunit [Thaumarchaeota archaeon]|nr:replication factor C large subunit [Candidatus Calditenuaceae archaeon]MDW8187247.1 replication factor C large subunit [Nitrososphaerota archaeon]